MKRPSVSFLAWCCLAFLLGVGTIRFGEEALKLSTIGFGRARDKTVEAVKGPVLARNYDAVVGVNTQQVKELEGYVDSLQAEANRTPERLGLSFQSEADYAHSCQTLRQSLASNLGYPPPGLLPGRSRPTLVRISADKTASYYDLTVPVFEGVNVRGLFIMPRRTDPSGRTPLIVAVHGRGGMPDAPASGQLSAVSRSNRDLAFGAVQKGYAVWEPLLVFYGDGYPPDIRDRLDTRARQSGTSLPAIEIAKMMRGIDALLETQPLDSSRVAMVGMSYGGFYTLYTTALEERIAVGVVAAYFNDRKSILEASEPFGNSDWRFANSLSIFQDPTVAALICPRPLEIQAGDHDQLFPVEGARRAASDAAGIYARLNVADRFSYLEFVGRHDFNGEEAWRFIDRYFSKSKPPEVARAP
jgi:dienelactone hydrolase